MNRIGISYIWLCWYITHGHVDIFSILMPIVMWPALRLWAHYFIYTSTKFIGPLAGTLPLAIFYGAFVSPYRVPDFDLFISDIGDINCFVPLYLDLGFSPRDHQPQRRLLFMLCLENQTQEATMTPQGSQHHLQLLSEWSNARLNTQPMQVLKSLGVKTKILVSHLS